MAWAPGPKPDYLDWDVVAEEETENAYEEWEYLGDTGEGKTPVLYHPETGNVHRGRLDHEAEQVIPHEEPSWEVKAEESLGEFLERFGNDVGWESLSEFAREHLEEEDR